MHGATIVSGSSTQAAQILDVFTIVLSIAAVILAIVIGLIILSIIKFRHSKRAEEPYQDFGNPKLETVWTIVPAILLGAVFVVTVKAMHDIQPPVRDQSADMVVTANQWWWKAEYPQSDVVVANELHMPVGKKWLIEVRSADVVHDFWVPNLGPKIDAIPGHPNYVWLTPQDTGHYAGMCAEYCGAEHAWMRFTVIVEPEARFDRWLTKQARPARRPTTQLEQEGHDLFMSMTCRNCHSIRGTAADGDIGPDLTHIASRSIIAGGVTQLNDSDLTSFIHYPQQIKPGSNMPNLALNDRQVRELVAYLESLK